MSDYFSAFEIVGEVADVLLLAKPERRLLVDISLDPAGHQSTGARTHPTRTSFTIVDEAIIDRFLSGVSIGDVAKATGTFSQSGYVPHRTTFIDTTFLLTDFTVLRKSLRQIKPENAEQIMRRVHPLH